MENIRGKEYSKEKAEFDKGIEQLNIEYANFLSDKLHRTKRTCPADIKYEYLISYTPLAIVYYDDCLLSDEIKGNVTALFQSNFSSK